MQLRALAAVFAAGLLMAAQNAQAAGHSAAAPASIVGDNQYHSITNGGTTSGGSRLALEVEGQCAAPTGYADINTYDPSHASEKWKFFLNPDGTANIQDSCDPSMALTAPTESGGAATLTHRDTNNITPQQKWKVTQDANGVLTIASAATGSVLDSCGTWVAGSTVVVDPDRQHTTQRWTVLS
ncbi:RICIN domain-containing protein [Streptomyces mobaraensis NBRC 13819 = DSM 40847]|uniref:Putative glycoside hydrolase n=1 Tax=Streptomyces mobaraensis (strain ATCC 29032 / DSM 40847 / JCM 4168 / NBRC 13819 / NCIMB 11159 / IPCR 16-22) TaxID=1223523 RepID=M3A0T8_STRM1|nr:RICIN domain-containing protein [Streptomyces mobaraensis]EME98678.1 putative glycoside hydrolase [Streptomyces mobaraensis NBRC 13819 = DSM 40847]QTT77150.1 RICIN domain-containing protein [Streptomyces mobaraensis NBRC 13819 = DSM 40847]